MALGSNRRRPYRVSCGKGLRRRLERVSSPSGRLPAMGYGRVRFQGHVLLSLTLTMGRGHFRRDAIARLKKLRERLECGLGHVMLDALRV